MIKKAEIYQSGNLWQKKVYERMAMLLEANPEIKSFGQSKNGNAYKHLLNDKQSKFNFITEEIHKETKERFNKHKAGDEQRILTNTAASQPYCFNLIIYLQQHPDLADKFFSGLLEKQVHVNHLEPEFTPNMCDIEGFERTGDESIGDQSKIGGTDADIAVFYTYENNKKGVLLIEFKFIEAEFSVCSSYKGLSQKKGETIQEKEERMSKPMEIRTICSSKDFYPKLLQSKETSSCGYKRKYANWELTENSKAIDLNKIKSSSACPFRFGLNQLWRNMLLAEQVAFSRQCHEFSFWVFSPKPNDQYLWKTNNSKSTETQFREILTDLGNKHFQKIYLETIFDKLQTIVSTQEDKVWLKSMENKYRI